MSEAAKEQLGAAGRIRQLLELFEELKALLPIALEIIECLKAMAPEDRERIGRVLVRLTDDDELSGRVEKAFKA